MACAIGAFVLGSALAYMVSQLAEEPLFDYGIYVSGILSLWVLIFIILDIKDKLKHHKGGIFQA